MNQTVGAGWPRFCSKPSRNEPENRVEGARVLAAYCPGSWAKKSQVKPRLHLAGRKLNLSRRQKSGSSIEVLWVGDVARFAKMRKLALRDIFFSFVVVVAAGAVGLVVDKE